jgi:hypothetical protein
MTAADVPPAQAPTRSAATRCAVSWRVRAASCLLPHPAALRVYDNSADADPAKGWAPEPVLVLCMERGKILNAAGLPNTPDWAKPLVVAALKQGMG